MSLVNNHLETSLAGRLPVRDQLREETVIYSNDVNGE
jgi:hypothetical protein